MSPPSGPDGVVDLAGAVGDFFSLTPDAVLDAVERSGLRTTGLCYPLNSLENRVYEVEVEDEDGDAEGDGRRRLVGKFYRPGRWSRETILDEHRMLAALTEAEVPVCAPTANAFGSTLHRTPSGIEYALFPRTGGRSPEELDTSQLEQLGRLLGRIHNVGAGLALPHRPRITPDTSGRECVALIEAHVERHGGMPPGLAHRYRDAATRLIEGAERRYAGVPLHPIHGDCHKGNLLLGRDGWFFLDFDDMAHGPAAQDLWLLLPGRPADCPAEVEALLRGYEQMRELDQSVSSMSSLVEALRGLRYLRYAAWIATRWDDPAFPRAFPYFGTDAYWEGQCADLYEQVRLIDGA